MKKRLWPALAAVLVILMVLTGCQDGLSATLQRMMEPFNDNNVYVNTGMIKVKTENVEAVKAATQTEKADAGGTKQTDGSIVISADDSEGTYSEVLSAVNGLVEGSTVSITIDPELASAVEKGVLEPMDEEAETSLMTSVASIMNSPSQTKLFQEEMNKEASEDSSNLAKGTYAVLASVLDTLDDSIKDTEYASSLSFLTDLTTSFKDSATSGETLTQGEVLQAQLLTNLVTKSATVINTVNEKGSDLSSLASDETVTDFIDYTLSAVNVTKALGGDSLFDLSSLVTALTGGSGTSESKNVAAVFTAARALKAASEEEGAKEVGFSWDSFITTGLIKIPTESEWTSETLKYNDFLKYVNLGKSFLNSLFGAQNGKFDTATTKGRFDAYSKVYVYYGNMLSSLGLADPTVDFTKYTGVMGYISDKLSATATTSILDAVLGFFISQFDDISEAVFGENEGDYYLDVIDDIYDNSGDFFTSSSVKGGETVGISETMLTNLRNAGVLPNADGTYGEKGEQTLENLKTEVENQGSYESDAAALDNLLKSLDLSSILQSIPAFGDGEEFSFKTLLEKLVAMLESNEEGTK